MIGSRRVTGLLLLLACLATAGLVHGLALLAIPHAFRRHDAFARVAAMTGENTKTVIPLRSMALPYRDPSMTLNICRYDVAKAPLRLSVTPFDRGFVSLGFHTRSGLAYYGLTLESDGLAPMTIIVAQAAQDKPTKVADGDEPADDVHVTAPEPEGFITMAAPVTDGATGLDHVKCVGAT